MKHTTKVRLTQSDLYVLIEGLDKIKSSYNEGTPKEFLFGKEYLNGLIRHLGSHLDKLGE